MSAIFNFERFMRLSRAHWAENARSYIWFFVVCMILYLVMSVLAMSGFSHRAYQHDNQMVCFYGGLMVTGAVFASRYFEGVSRKESALTALMRPASSFEKWLLAWVVVAVLYPLVYTLVYSAINYPVVLLAKTMAATDALASYDHSYKIDGSAISKEQFVQNEVARYQLFIPFLSKGSEYVNENALIGQGLMFLVLNAIQAFCVGASLYFKRSPMLKTILVGFLIVISYLTFVVATPFAPSALIEYWVDYVGKERHFAWWQSMVVYLTWFGFPFLLWVCAYFHLKEREVM